MAGVLDFLFEGKPPASTTTYGTTTENMPRWLSDYTQGLISRANAIAAEPYQAYGGPRLAGPTADTTSAYGLTRGTVGQVGQQYGTLLQSPGAMQAAQPYINQAAQTFPGQAQQYMNPYIENVIGRSTTLANRALTEKFLPALEGTFGSRGQDFRSSAYRRAADRGVRDLTEGLQEQAGAQLAGGYSEAAQTFGQDQSRLAGLAGTVGNMANTDINTRSSLLRALQEAGLTGAGALDAIGKDQQGEQQRSLDLARGDFEQQRDYPRSTIDWMNSVIRGVPFERQTGTSSTGPADVYGASPASQLASLGTGIAGLIKAFKIPGQPAGQARGGRMRAYAKGGMTRGTLGWLRDNTHLTTTREADLLGAIEKLQGRIKRLPPGHPERVELAETLGPLFEEMARRQREVPVGKFHGGRMRYARGGRVIRGTI